MKVIVDSRLRFQPPPLLAERLKEEFTRVNPQHMKLKSMGYAAYGEPYELKAWREEGGYLTLPRGGAEKLVEIARACGERAVFEDKRSAGKPADFRDLSFAPRDYQEDIAQMIADRQNLLVRAGAGGGKTVAAMLFITRAARSALVVVHSNALREQWLARIESDMGIPKRAVGTIQGKRFELRNITVGMAQTLAKLDSEWAALNAHFGVIVQDEVQTCGAATFNSVIDRSEALYRVGISDSERRKDGKTFLIYDQFGDVGYEIEHEALVEAGHVVDVEVLVKISETPDVSWYRQKLDAEDGKPDNQAFNRLISELVADDRRNERIVNTVASYACEHATLVFSHRVEHCRLISAMLTGSGVSNGLMLGGSENAGELARTVQGLKDGTIAVGVGTIQAVGTGIDIPLVSRGVVATPLGANKQLWRQVRGRINRKHAGKERALICYFHDPSAFGDRPIRNLRAWNRTVRVQEAGEALAIDADDYLMKHSEPSPFLVQKLPEWPE